MSVLFDKSASTWLCVQRSFPPVNILAGAAQGGDIAKIQARRECWTCARREIRAVYSAVPQGGHNLPWPLYYGRGPNGATQAYITRHVEVYERFESHRLPRALPPRQSHCVATCGTSLRRCLWCELAAVRAGDLVRVIRWKLMV